MIYKVYNITKSNQSVSISCNEYGAAYPPPKHVVQVDSYNLKTAMFDKVALTLTISCMHKVDNHAYTTEDLVLKVNNKRDAKRLCEQLSEDMVMERI